MGCGLRAVWALRGPRVTCRCDAVVSTANTPLRCRRSAPAARWGTAGRLCRVPWRRKARKHPWVPKRTTATWGRRSLRSEATMTRTAESPDAARRLPRRRRCRCCSGWCALGSAGVDHDADPPPPRQRRMALPHGPSSAESSAVGGGGGGASSSATQRSLAPSTPTVHRSMERPQKDTRTPVRSILKPQTVGDAARRCGRSAAPPLPHPELPPSFRERQGPALCAAWQPTVVERRWDRLPQVSSGARSPTAPISGSRPSNWRVTAATGRTAQRSISVDAISPVSSSSVDRHAAAAAATAASPSQAPHRLRKPEKTAEKRRDMLN